MRDLYLLFYLLTINSIFVYSQSVHPKTIQNENNPTVEPHLAINSTNNDYMVVGAMEFPGKNKDSQICVFYSTDKGKTWNKSSQIENEKIKGSDPYLGYNSKGLLYFTYISNSNAYLRTSSDNGKTWSDPILWPKNGGGSFDYVKLVVTKSKGDYKDFVYLWASQNYNLNGIRVSPASFLSFKYDNESIDFKKMVLPGNLSYQVGSIGVFSNGEILAPFHEIDVNGDYVQYPRLWVTKSEDSGNSFSSPFLVHQNFVADSPDLTIDISSKSNFIDRAYMAWLELDKREEGISYWNNFMSFSIDKGKTWHKPKKINDTVLMGKHPSHHPRVTVNNLGVIVITWKDSRHASIDEKDCFDLYMTYSSDGGENFSTNIRLTKNTSCANVDGNKIEYKEGIWVYKRYGDGGDYHGLSALNDNSFQVVWSDSENGVFQLKTMNIKL